MGCAAAPSNVIRPYDHFSNGSRSHIGNSKTSLAFSINPGTLSHPKSHSENSGAKVSFGTDFVQSVLLGGVVSGSSTARMRNSAIQLTRDFPLREAGSEMGYAINFLSARPAH